MNKFFTFVYLHKYANILSQGNKKSKIFVIKGKALFVRRFYMNKKKIIMIFLAVLIITITALLSIPFWKTAGKPADREAFFDAIRTRDPGLLKKIGEKRPALANETYTFPGPKSREYTPLQLAAEKGNITAIQFLIENGADINRVTATLPHAPLVLAAMRHKSTAAWLLMDKGARLDIKSETAKNLLIMALSEDNQDKFNLLKSRGIDLNQALPWAWKERRLDKLEFLRSNGADVPKMLGWTPLHSAAYAGDQKKVEELVKKGAKMDQKDNLGRTPLDCAIIGGNTGTAKFLIAAGADTLYSNSEESPLLYAVEKGDREIAEILISKGADIKIKLHCCETLLHVAASKGDVKMADLLISKGSDINAKGAVDSTPLHYAVSNDRIEMVKYLLSKGADINAREACSSTALHSAAINGYADMAELLISKGADVNLKNSNGETPMEQAICSKKDEIVDVFMKHGEKMKNVF